MQIHELSMLTGINPETIRSYRLKGLIHPVQKDNGYYDYTVACLIELTYIRKMRGLQNPWGSEVWGTTLGDLLNSTLGDRDSFEFY